MFQLCTMSAWGESHLHYWQSNVPMCDGQCKPSHRNHIRASNQLHTYSTATTEFPVTNNLKSGWIIKNKVEGEVGPVHALTTYMGKRGQTSLTPHVGIRWRWSPSYPSQFPPNETTPPLSTEQDTGWAPEPNWAFWGSETSLSLPGSELWIVQLIA
jgi:hypothetical protein